MIKNWTVITQPVRNGSDGVACRERYLMSIKHPNHKYTSEILNIIGNDKTTRYIALIGEQYRLRQQMSGKPGRHLSSYAMEYCLTLPKGISPTNNEWEKIINYCCNSLMKLCKVTQNQEFYFKKNIRAVLHKQDQTSKSGSGDHVHLILGKVLAGANTRVLKELQSKKATSILKSSFNTAVLNYVGLSYRDYTPSEINKTKKIEIWKHHNIENKKTSDELSRIQKQIEKWFAAFEERDYRQLNRQFNRISKSYIDLSASKTMEEKTLANLSKTIEKIESLSGRKLIR
ncbi:DUF3450 domain-containing protein [Vibrio parahaemolyticus]|uniref:hypothetical protein n=1 Tax=Vibrio parahaemolyticus TaxID=670 RepID=UPI003891C753